MREPTITVGFIIFREGYEMELRKDGLFHSEVAERWVKSSPFNEVYNKIMEDKQNTVYNGYEDFLLNYVGAIKLYDLEGERLCCYIPRGNNCESKSYLRDYFTNSSLIRFGQEISYEMYGDINEELVHNIQRPEYIPIYNKSIIMDSNGIYHYNPARQGD